MTFRLGRVKLVISFWFTAVLTLLLTLAPRIPAAESFLFCILHELGHLSAMALLGQRPSEIELGYFGMKIIAPPELTSQRSDFLVALAGPLMNFIAAAVCFFLGRNDYMSINLALAIFNLLPVGVLDGGRALKCVIGESFAHRKIEIAAASVMIVLGVIQAVFSRGNFTLLIVSLYLAIGAVTTKP